MRYRGTCSHRQLLTMVLTVMVAGCSGTVPPEPAPPTQGLDILYIGPLGNSVAQLDGAGLIDRLGPYLVDHAQRLAPDAFRLAATTGIVYPESWPLSQDGAGALSTSRYGPVIDGSRVDVWGAHTAALAVDLGSVPAYLDVMKLALDGRNARFPRPDAMLAIVIFATDDDCSLADPGLLWDIPRWPETHSGSVYTRCADPLPDLLTEPASYLGALLAAHPQRIFVAAFASPMPSSFVPLNNDSSQLVVEVFAQCGWAFQPAPRLGRLVELINAAKHPRLRASLFPFVHQNTICPYQQAAELGAQLVAFGEL